jgi:hypothetical protein
MSSPKPVSRAVQDAGFAFLSQPLRNGAKLPVEAWADVELIVVARQFLPVKHGHVQRGVYPRDWGGEDVDG